ncbi:MAG: arginine--tRNA ligase [Parcubacteria group bacterium CG10_big_fil_rev_8_21_14_0_10_36_14]|nr:MAG: arginine--tRNA ligase [Parcubacteria group bacterium CG10_big_fil_rev_8_21_14_0_10_36_14]
MFLQKLKSDLAKSVNKTLGSNLINGADFEYPPENIKGGDLALPLFKLAKELKKKPQDIAKNLQKVFKKQKLIERTEAKGAYLNIYLNRAKTGAEILNELQAQDIDNNYINVGKGEKVSIEYMSPNSNKPLHLGHIRNAYLGSSIANIMQFCGYQVNRECLVNDRGIAICKAMLAYEFWGKNDSPAKSGLKSDHFVGKYYVLFEEKAKKDKSLPAKAQKLLQEWEVGDENAMQLWEKMQKWVLSGYKQTYKRLGVSFDKVFYESKLFKKGREIIEKYLKEGKVEKDANGNVIIKLENCGLPDKILLREDGTAIYITTDMALAKTRLDSGYKKVFYVVGSEQDLYFKQLFCAIEKLGLYTGQTDLIKRPEFHHLSYGLVELPEGRMKSREGTVVDADDLLDKMEEIAKEEINIRHDFMKEGEVDRRSEIIASSALRFYILNVNPATKIRFNPKESLSFTGKTGPYLLYTYARLHSIWRKGKGKGMYERLDFSLLKEDKLWILVLGIAKFPEAVISALDGLDPEEISAYLYDLSVKVSDFYHNVRVLDADFKERRISIAIIDSLLDIFKKGTALLGIEVLDEM